MTETYRTILYRTVEPAIAQITLNRPDRLNAYTGQMCDEIVAALHEYMEDDGLRCLILTGAGKGFCSGGDVAGAPVSGERKGPSYRSKQMGHGQEMRVGMHRVIAVLHRMDKPVVAMVNGAAVAGGLTLALACDFRIAADSAKLGDTSGRFALLPDEGGAWFFPRFMGLDRALKMSLLAEIYPAAEALKLGLVTEVVAAADLTAHTLALARAVASRGPLAVRLAKNMMRKGLDSSLENSLDDAALSVMIANPAADVREGVAAFFAKREPKFEGR
ncbi:MAG TPA: enoyl-CoA hydratase-related protein [Rhizomicrobium sp.]|jgi:2-(1,2-epoxy-1,2-dihydrophenyl)acetyl-CoA isomerase|nr:enoyl-CoA hydratase-related protein [Rhizomicrobium sp.]